MSQTFLFQKNIYKEDEETEALNCQPNFENLENIKMLEINKCYQLETSKL